MSTPDANARLWRGPTLVLDAATATVHAGVLREGRWASLEARPGEALETIFHAVERALDAAELELAGVSALALGIGPGSILGLRLALMAVETWRRLPAGRDWSLHAFSGLQTQARILAAQDRDTFHLLTDFRRGQWHRVTVCGGLVGGLEVVDDATAAEATGSTYLVPTGRAAPGAPPTGAEPLPFSLEALPALAPGDWAAPTEAPALYLPAAPTFARWTAERHR